MASELKAEAEKLTNVIKNNNLFIKRNKGKYFMKMDVMIKEEDNSILKKKLDLKLSEIEIERQNKVLRDRGIELGNITEEE